MKIQLSSRMWPAAAMTCPCCQHDLCSLKNPLIKHQVKCLVQICSDQLLERWNTWLLTMFTVHVEQDIATHQLEGGGEQVLSGGLLSGGDSGTGEAVCIQQFL